MVFEAEVVVPAEIQEEVVRITHFDPGENEELLKIDTTFTDTCRLMCKRRLPIGPSYNT